ncbi:class III lanthionine synthetase LanKC [Actinoplanes sp. RD1]|uniref:class III lanthionine synthetase LanKC n=1 Tax=Actinoplanes sp. RD1 TaxID=3064538 RepID=UPI0027409C70|nr:class III lanthionine synthetase LanKC [Actinoplanes sp. RD1]
MLDTRYIRFCSPGTDFYELPGEDGGDDFPLVTAALPEGWVRHVDTPWVGLHPPAVQLPEQGWKVHVSTTLEAAADRLATTWGYCRDNGIVLKFLRGPGRVMDANAKYAERGSSGKFITLYPLDETHCEKVLLDLEELLGGQPGPYILSDRRWREGPLFVRYGGFSPRHCHNDKGELTPAIARPDGTLVPDVREARFSVPDWVRLPDFLAAAPSPTATSGEFGYRPTSALHFSNAGGVYLADDKRTGERVVLKEARPHAGLDPSGADAVTRLRREAEILRRLDGLDVAPRFHGAFTAWEHQFVAMEVVDGLDLKRAAMERIPILHPGSTEQDTRDYVGWALEVLDRIEAGMAAIHERGVVLGDVHPKNILVRDGRPVFIDFEFSGLDDPEHRGPLAAPGFAPPGHLRGVAADRWGLGALRLDMFLPLTNAVDLEPGKVRQLARTVGRRYGLPREYVDRMIAELLGSAAATGFRRPVTGATRRFLEGEEPVDWPGVSASMARAILATATPERTDRLFPADIEAFSRGQGLGFAYGAAGILHTLHATGHGRHPEHERWLLDRVRASEDVEPGFYSGLHGVAYTLLELGRAADAREVLDRARRSTADLTGHDYFRGLSGAALNLLHFADATGDAELAAEAVAAADRLAATMRSTPPPERPDAERGLPGVLRGWSGPGLLFLRLYERTGDPALLDLAAEAVRRDLANCTLTRNGTLEADQGWRTLPYLEIGGVGVGMVLSELLRHRPDTDLAEADHGIDRSAAYEYYVQPTLHFGRAGIVTYLAHRRATRPGADVDDRITRLLDTLNDQAVPCHGHVAFPGNQSLRLSMDVATGTAGVLLAVHTARHGGPGLPFLGATPQSSGNPAGEK